MWQGVARGAATAQFTGAGVCPRSRTGGSPRGEFHGAAMELRPKASFERVCFNTLHAQ